MLTSEIACIVVLKLKDGYAFAIPELALVVEYLFVHIRLLHLQLISFLLFRRVDLLLIRHIYLYIHFCGC